MCNAVTHSADRRHVFYLESAMTRRRMLVENGVTMRRMGMEPLCGTLDCNCGERFQWWDSRHGFAEGQLHINTFCLVERQEGN